MDLGLKEFGATLAVGAYLLLGLLLVVVGLLGRPAWRFLVGWSRRRWWWTGAAVLILSVGLGIMVEDASDRYLSEVPKPLEKWLFFLLPAEDDLKVDALFKRQRDGAESDHRWRSLSPLGRSLYGLDAFRRHGGEAGLFIDAHLPDEIAKASEDHMVAAAQDMYYHAKSEVYRDDNLFGEMNRIQLRINYVRAFLFVTMFLFALTGLTAAWLLGALAYRSIVKPSDRPASVRLRAAWTAGSFVLLFFVAWFCAETFRWEEIQFNSRAFGYWASRERAAGNPTVTRFPAISGASSYDKSAFVVVHDTKLDESAPRVGLVWTSSDYTPAQYRVLSIDWPDPNRKPNDLESICAIPGARGEFLAAESRHWERRKRDGTVEEIIARIWHLEIERSAPHARCFVRGFIELPKDIDNIEGIACFPPDGNDGRRTLILGERRVRKNESDEPYGSLLWTRLDLGRHEISTALTETRVLDDRWMTRPGSRACSDLFLDSTAPSASGTSLLIVMSVDPDRDDGPFRSQIVRAMLEAAAPPSKEVATETVWQLDGLKVEAIARDTSSARRYWIGTDDEALGGVWRPLPPEN